jgi:hypothetical protein
MSSSVLVRTRPVPLRARSLMPVGRRCCSCVLCRQASSSDFATRRRELMEQRKFFEAQRQGVDAARKAVSGDTLSLTRALSAARGRCCHPAAVFGGLG